MVAQVLAPKDRDRDWDRGWDWDLDGIREFNQSKQLSTASKGLCPLRQLWPEAFQGQAHAEDVNNAPILCLQQLTPHPWGAAH